MSGPVRTRGLVLRTFAYSDTSQIVWAFCRDEGITSLLAKGSRRLPRRSSSFPAPFDVTGWYDIVYRRRSGDLHLATEARLIEGFPHLRSHLAGWLDVCLAIEATLRVFQPNDPHPGFLRGTLSYLKLLGVGHGRRPLRVHFHTRLLQAAGVTPEWDRCSECGEPLTDGDTALALRIPAGLACGRCRRAGDETIAAATARYLHDEARVPWGRIPHLDPPEAVVDEAWSLLRRLLLHLIERPLKALEHIQR